MGNIRINGDGTTSVGGIDVKTPYDDKKSGVKVEDFLNLMVAQMTNQDFLNPADDTQYITQMAQFATMQAMQELSAYSQTSYVSSLVGKTVTVASYGLGGNVNSETGVVSSVNLSGDEHTITVNGKQYKLSQIMNIATTDTAASNLNAANKLTPIIQSATESSIQFRWDAPLADTDGLVYDVYYTKADSGLDFGSIDGVKKGTLAIQGTRDNTYTLTGLEPGTTYNINIVVRNASGDQAIYSYATRKTNAK